MSFTHLSLIKKRYVSYNARLGSKYANFPLVINKSNTVACLEEAIRYVNV